MAIQTTAFLGGIEPVKQFAQFIVSLGMVRFILIAGGWILLLWWTVARVTGENDDPTLGMARNSMTGGFTFLVSGTGAVGFVSLLLILLWLPEIMVWSPTAQVALPALIVIHGIHWWIERRERM